MVKMNTLIFVLGLATTFASLSTGHTVFTTLFINDVNQGDGTCVRMPMEGNICTHPIAGMNSPDMACGRDGQQAVAFTCPAPAGAKLTFEFRMWADGSQPGSIDPSHLGSTAIYLKAVSNMSTDSAAGPGWFKVFDEGYDVQARRWATERLIANHGLLSIDLPSGLPTGYYLARSEIVTIQNVTSSGYVDPQFYVGCAQLFIQGRDANPLTIPSDKMVTIPGHARPSDPGLTFNIRKDDPVQTPYRVIGPEPFFPQSPSSATTTTTTTTTNNDKHQPQTQKTQTDGLIPAACLLKNANWCALAVPPYANETACWAASVACFRQLDACYRSAPPTGSRGCRRWEDGMCAPIQAGCRAGRWLGPGPPPPSLGEGEGEVSQPVLPAAVNAEQEEQASQGLGRGQGQDDSASSKETTFTAGAAATATETEIATPGCGSRRQRQRRLV